MYNGYYQPYMTPYKAPQMPYNEQFNQQVQTPMNTYNQGLKQGLQGKMVDGYETVKAMDIPYDGSTSYFPSTNGKTIYTKQLQMDGNVKVLKYVLEEENAEKVEIPSYATKEDIEGYFDAFKNELEELKKVIDKKGKKDDE